MKTFLLLNLLSVFFWDHTSARRGGGVGGGGGFGTRPRPVPRPSTPSRPGTPSNRPAPRPNNDGFASGFKPSSRPSPQNSNPSQKPFQSNNGAPTVPSGGGGYYYNRAPGGFSGASLFFAGASGFLLGSFLYGGIFSSPSCRGGYDYGSNRYCNYGQSSTNHQCAAQIPLCPIPESIRTEWYTGSSDYVELLQDASTCAINAELGGAIVARQSNNGTATNNTTTERLTLPECLERVVLSGTCTSGRFTYDEEYNKCGCCAAGSSITTWEFTSSVYSVSTQSPLEKYGAPTHCISGATLYWPKKSTTNTLSGSNTNNGGGGLSGGGNYITETHACQCGECKACGSSAARFMEWRGPYVVSDALGLEDGAKARPLYDAVETCLCNDANVQCTVNGLQSLSAAPSYNSIMMWSSGLILLSAVVLL